jgi:phage gp29-like protein
MGQSSSGSYALGNIKGTLAAMAVESKLKEICNVINQHLIPLLGKLNGWNIARLPTMTAEDLEAISLEEVSKYLQRVGSIGFLPRTPEVVNKILDVLGLDALAEDVTLDEVLTPSTSRAGDGMATPFEGTSTKQGNGTDTSAKNLDNKA